MSDTVIYCLSIAVPLLAIIFRQRQKITALRHLHAANPIMISGIREQERRKTRIEISKEIHDNTSQLLGLAHVNMTMVLRNTHANIQVYHIIKDTLSYLERASTSLRTISHNLRGQELPEGGLIEAISLELEKIQASFRMKTFFELSGAYVPMPAENELVIFRIVQEALHNVIKHAKATAIEIVAKYNGQRFELLISDNGVGVEVNNLRTKNGIGLKNMLERAESLQGSISIRRGHLGGTVVNLQCPLAEYHTMQPEIS